MSEEEKLLTDEFSPGPQELLRQQLEGDRSLGLFIAEWLKNGLNARLAYQKLHPGVGSASARTLGSRKLTKVDISALLPSYELSLDVFLKHLQEGLSAIRVNELGEQVPDFRVRYAYLQMQAKLLKVF